MAPPAVNYDKLSSYIKQCDINAIQSVASEVCGFDQNILSIQRIINIRDIVSQRKPFLIKVKGKKCMR